MQKQYIAIDLKSFYASVECADRGWDPFAVNLVVADASRGPGAITLAATPAIKRFGVKSRGRLFEIPKTVPYIAVRPRMKRYMEYSARIYKILLKYVSSDDVHVYSIDEAFVDVTSYQRMYRKNAKQIAQMMIADIYASTRIVATCGIGTNLFLAKVALDIMAKHDPEGIGVLDRRRFCEALWHHRPLTDFWMIGRGIARRLEQHGIYDLYGVTRCDPEILYKEFGVNAEYLIDHAWGREPVEIADIKRYVPRSHSLSASQILFEEYNAEDALTVVKEMVDDNVLKLTERHLVTGHLSLGIGYAKGAGSSSHGSQTLAVLTSSYRVLREQCVGLFWRIVKKDRPIRRLWLSFGHLCEEEMEQWDLFTDVDALEKEKKMQEVLVEIKQKYGRNAIWRGTDALEKATAKTRNTLIGGHHE